jgi:hypothetical protein
MVDAEFKAMGAIIRALDRLDGPARRRVMHYVFDRVEPLAFDRANGEAEDDDEGREAEH